MNERMIRAADAYHKNQRFRLTADSCVAYAHQKFGRINPERAERDAHDLARDATVLLLQCIYEDDAEIARLRCERDHYKAMAEESLRFAGPRPILLRASDTDPMKAAT